MSTRPEDPLPLSYESRARGGIILPLAMLKWFCYAVAIISVAVLFLLVALAVWVLSGL